MTKKDYERLAEALNQARYHWLYVMDEQPTNPVDAFRAGYEAARAEIAKALEEDNPQFNRERFYEACER